MPRQKAGFPVRYSPMGDSLTAGYYATVDSKKFTQVFADKVKLAQGMRPVVLGAGSYGGLLQSGIDALDTIVSQQPTFVSIEYGTNDCNPANNVTVDAFKAQLNQLIDGLLSRITPKPQLVLCTTWNQGVQGDPYDQAIKDIGAQRGIPVVDFDPLWAVAANRGPAGVTTYRGASDTFHPNDTGMSAIAQALYDTVISTLKVGDRLPLSSRTVSAARSTVNTRQVVN